jgi:arsenite methyltransferase
VTSTAHFRLRDRRGEYGFDGLLAGVLGMAAGGVSLLVLATVLVQAGHGGSAAFSFVGAALLLLTLGIYLHTTRRGKFAVWVELIEDLHLLGDEQVLDVGCGRGAVLAMVAKLLPRGRAVGIDLWRIDQSGNSPDAARRNLETEGVQDRCRVMTGDARAMPFPDASFDLIVSSLAIHNIRDRAGRSRAIDEIIRVLKPGGRLLIADPLWTSTYARQLQDRGLLCVQRRHLGWRFWWGLAFPATYLVTASKAA